MTVPIEEKKKEAVERMKIIGIFPQTIEQFENEGLVSQSLPPIGACYWIEGDQLERVKQFEAENNALVYHVIHGLYSIGGERMELEDYLYVSDYPEEWELDRADIEGEEKQALVYSNNLTFPEFSEFGAIGLALTPAAGLRRRF